MCVNLNSVVNFHLFLFIYYRIFSSFSFIHIHINEFMLFLIKLNSRIKYFIDTGQQIMILLNYYCLCKYKMIIIMMMLIILYRKRNNNKNNNKQECNSNNQLKITDHVIILTQRSRAMGLMLKT